jgi:hypothetical protein
MEKAMPVTSSWKRVWLLGPLLLLAACSSLRVSTDQYPAADFSGYRSYAWIADDPLIRPHGATAEISALTIRRIREAIEAELAAKGYAAAASPASADFVVAFTVGTRDRIDAQSYPAPYRGHWEWAWYREQMDMQAYHEETRLRVYHEGTLAIDIFDGAKHQPVWHGRARKEITVSDESDPGPLIKKATAAILQKFPSRQQGATP